MPRGFQFAVKVPRAITHQHRLLDSDSLLAAFLAECAALGPALGLVVCEPPHASWFTGAGDALLAAYQVARVAADPAVVPAAAQPGGWTGLVYYRLHGAPRVYYSAYDAATLDTLADQLHRAARTSPAWCIFDNTAAGAATANALDLLAQLRGEPVTAQSR